MTSKPPRRPLDIAIWHVHGSWLAAFLGGADRYRLPVTPGDPRGRKRAAWSAAVTELEPGNGDRTPIDVVVFQNVGEVDAAARWLGTRRVPAIYVEHNAPEGRINEMRHPLADRDDLTIVHVTHFNALLWDTGSTPTTVIEHGVPDPGYRYSGELPHAAAIVNEARRRGRVTGTDLLPRFEAALPVDLFGIGSGRDLPHPDLHAEIGRRRAYLHPYRWTSLGLSLLEAMLVGMPPVALATTEAPQLITPESGVCSNDLRVLTAALRALRDDPDAAREMGRRARERVLERYPYERFLAAWQTLLDDVAARGPALDLRASAAVGA